MKRFTETRKWADPWFWRLSAKAKLLWLWLLDNCDNAGVIEIDLKMASSGIGETIEEKHLTELGDRLQKVSDRKWRIPKFIRFQFGELKPTSIIHRSIIALLKFHSLPEDGSFSSNVNPMPMGCQSHMDKDKEKEKEKDAKKYEIDAFPENLNNPKFKAVWGRWHEHLGQKRKPATVHARDLQLVKLSIMGTDKAIEAINHSIEHNWQGIYEPNTNNGSSTSKPNPRNAGVITGPPTAGYTKPRFQREREEKERLAGQVAKTGANPPPT